MMAKETPGQPDGRCPFGYGTTEGAAQATAPQYVSYARMDELHRLQYPRTNSPLELNFILLSQVKELLFRMVFVELDQARSQLRADLVDDGCRSLARAVRTQRVLVAAWESMNGMPVDEFLVFRDILGQASGTQSFMYRTLEFIMGNKDPHMVGQSADNLALFPALRAELDAPSVYDEALRFLARQGLHVPADVVDRNFSLPYVPHEQVEGAWLTVYRDPRKYWDEYRVAEQLVEVSYQFSHWRSTHLLVVERMLGRKHGTAGTTGVGWLRLVNEHRFFPELWSVRTLL